MLDRIPLRAGMTSAKPRVTALPAKLPASSPLLPATAPSTERLLPRVKQ